MNVQEAAEGPNITSYQMRSSFGEHESEPGRLTVHASTPPWVQDELQKMGYKVEIGQRNSGPINAILLDREHGTMWGGSSDYGEDYGIGVVKPAYPAGLNETAARVLDYGLCGAPQAPQSAWARPDRTLHRGSEQRSRGARFPE